MGGYKACSVGGVFIQHNCAVLETGTLYGLPSYTSPQLRLYAQNTVYFERFILFTSTGGFGVPFRQFCSRSSGQSVWLIMGWQMQYMGVLFKESTYGLYVNGSEDE